ncbi:hypothetical protein SODG_005158 [Sodalis praecaptivus]
MGHRAGALRSVGDERGIFFLAGLSGDGRLRLYVWLAVAVTLLSLAVLLGHTLMARRQLLRAIRRQQARAERRRQGALRATPAIPRRKFSEPTS